MNLVKLYGFLEHGDEKVIVVEYVGNGNLREHLDGKLQEVLPSYSSTSMCLGLDEDKSSLYTLEHRERLQIKNIWKLEFSTIVLLY